MVGFVHGAIALVTASGIAVAGFLGLNPSASAEPVKSDKTVVITVCGSGGLVPPTAENKCHSKP